MRLFKSGAGPPSATPTITPLPNGEICTVRNFSRERFSTSSITLNIATKDLSNVLALLEEFAEEAVSTLPNFLETWQVIRESGVIGEQTELTLLARSRFGKAAEKQPRLFYSGGFVCDPT